MNSWNGWTVEETKELFEKVNEVTKAGKGLKAAFEAVAVKTGRKANSVRNYYYAQAKTLSMVPGISGNLGIKEFRAPQKPGFTAFKAEEVEDLICLILREQAAGKSVRAITAELAHGDKTIMLRLQNKYRSIVFSRRRTAERYMERLRRAGTTYYNPYTRRIALGGREEVAPAPLADGFKMLSETLPEEEFRPLLTGLIALAERAERGGHAAHARADALAREVERLSGEVMRLREENTSLSARKTEKFADSAAALSRTGARLMQLNEYFLAKEDKDKIKSLGEYVTELNKILGKKSGTV